VSGVRSLNDETGAAVLATQMVTAVPTITSVSQPADTVAVVTVRWRLERSHPLEPWTFGNTYNLARVGDGWKIAVSTVHAA